MPPADSVNEDDLDDAYELFLSGIFDGIEEVGRWGLFRQNQWEALSAHKNHMLALTGIVLYGSPNPTRPSMKDWAAALRG